MKNKIDISNSKLNFIKSKIASLGDDVDVDPPPALTYGLSLGWKCKKSETFEVPTKNDIKNWRDCIKRYESIAMNCGPTYYQ